MVRSNVRYYDLSNVQEWLKKYIDLALYSAIAILMSPIKYLVIGV